jgi:hypothetical protein
MLKISRIGFGVLFAAVVCGLLVPHARTWGFHFLAYYSVAARIVLLILALAIIAVGTARPRNSRPNPLQSLENFFGPLATDFLLAFACGIVFVLCSAATPLMGDGQLWLNEVMSNASDYARNRAPLTLLSVHGLYGILSPLGFAAQRVFGLTSALAGVASVLAWLRLRRHLGTDLLSCLLLGFSWSGVAFFCGYIETYVLAAALLTWTFVLVIISLDRGRPSWIPVLLGLIAPAFSFAFIVFVPALAVYVWWTIKRKSLSPRTVLFSSFCLLVVAATVYFSLGWYHGNDLFLALRQVATRAHGLDFINSIFFVAGPFLVLVAAWLIAVRFRILWSVKQLVLFLAILFPLIALIMHNPQLGMARDWDIAALLLLAAPVISMLIWSRVTLDVSAVRQVKSFLAAWILLIIVPWIGVQASSERTIHRFTDLLALDPASAATGWDYLGSYDLHRGDVDGWSRCNLEALRYSPNPRYHVNLAFYFALKRDWKPAFAHADAAHAAILADSSVTERESEVVDSRQIVALGKSYLDRAYLSDARLAFELAAHLEPHALTPRLATVDMLLRLNKYREAADAMDSLVFAAPMQLDSARAFFQSFLTSRISYSLMEGYLGLGMLAASTADTEAARSNFNLALLESGRDSALAKLLSDPRFRMISHAP